ncbi:molecular chaperone DnaJ [Synechococcus sp. RSCCF101]|uniref:molecular chaperone DnaJ n=1 Tax=Synechococcus sp. RSCCF101 TaxID=2511069 RepID=UPI0012440219|nr:molecular chaperone DnaJ [Synechococcus sp. RSCCF101]QEY31737.1 molecular chaperone DnaJ [Synechococcus sp. RSCCF101]
MAQPSQPSRRRITLTLPDTLLEQIDALKQQWGLRSRGDILTRLLEELFEDRPLDSEADDDGLSSSLEDELDTQGALVLLRTGDLERLGPEDEGAPGADEPAGTGASDAGPTPGARPPQPAGASHRGRGLGIDLPGFVRSRSSRLRNSLRPPERNGNALEEAHPGLVALNQEQLEAALLEVTQHWQSLYGQPPGQPVLDAALQWLQAEIWGQSELAEGQPFTWNQLDRVMVTISPSWPVGAPTFASAIVAAGMLEDPFGGDSLGARVPTLIRRFVHRFRRRRRGTSFEALEQTMSIHSALRLLGLPTTPGEAMTLQRIRDAFREQAMDHHPDSGGSTEQMRRLNEAYQLLKECYRARR